MNTETLKWIVVVGDPVDGFDHYGPFDNRDDAFRYADGLKDRDWWLAPLIATTGGVE